MKQKRETFIDWSHINPWKILDRGSPVLRIFFILSLGIVLGSLFSLFQILIWINGFIIFLGAIMTGYWFYLQIA